MERGVLPGLGVAVPAARAGLITEGPHGAFPRARHADRVPDGVARAGGGGAGTARGAVGGGARAGGRAAAVPVRVGVLGGGGDAGGRGARPDRGVPAGAGVGGGRGVGRRGTVDRFPVPMGAGANPTANPTTWLRCWDCWPRWSGGGGRNPTRRGGPCSPRRASRWRGSTWRRGRDRTWLPSRGAESRSTRSGPRWRADALARLGEEIESPEYLPAALRAAPGFSDPRREGGAAFVASLLAPVRSGVILLRDDLVRLGDDTGLACRAGERRYVLNTFLAQDPGVTLDWLGGPRGAVEPEGGGGGTGTDSGVVGGARGGHRCRAGRAGRGGSARFRSRCAGSGCGRARRAPRPPRQPPPPPHERRRPRPRRARRRQSGRRGRRLGRTPLLVARRDGRPERHPAHHPAKHGLRRAGGPAERARPLHVGAAAPRGRPLRVVSLFADGSGRPDRAAHPRRPGHHRRAPGAPSTSRRRRSWPSSWA